MPTARRPSRTSTEFLSVPMDAVVISTPAHVREPLCLAAFEKGLHVLSEKPLHHTVEGSRRILAAAKAAKRHLGAGFNMRYYPAFSYIRDVMESGRIGEIDHIRIYGGHEGLPKFAFDWEYKSEISGGGALWDVGIHMSDMARLPDGRDHRGLRRRHQQGLEGAGVGGQRDGDLQGAFGRLGDLSGDLD